MLEERVYSRGLTLCRFKETEVAGAGRIDIWDDSGGFSVLAKMATANFDENNFL